MCQCRADVLGIFEDPTDCNGFCVCSGSEGGTRGECPGAQHFSVSERQCVDAADAGCEMPGTYVVVTSRCCSHCTTTRTGISHDVYVCWCCVIDGSVHVDKHVISLSLTDNVVDSYGTGFVLLFLDNPPNTDDVQILISTPEDSAVGVTITAPNSADPVIDETATVRWGSATVHVYF